MICQECGQRPATMHFTKIINGDKTESHLCDHCSQEKGEMFMFPGNTAFSINDLLSGLLNNNKQMSQSKESAVQNNKVVQCDRCKLTYEQFTKIGRFGCSDCYKTFQPNILPILKRLHAGNTSHTGKIPKRIGGGLHIQKEIEELKTQLQSFIETEEFEKAAEVRDRIRNLEKVLNEQGDR